jgi:hypothetical protein
MDANAFLLIPADPRTRLVFKGKATLDEPKDNEAMVEDENYSENLVFGAKTQNFQPELGSGVVYYSLKRRYKLELCLE